MGGGHRGVSKGIALMALGIALGGFASKGCTEGRAQQRGTAASELYGRNLIGVGNKRETHENPQEKHENQKISIVFLVLPVFDVFIFLFSCLGFSCFLCMPGYCRVAIFLFLLC